MTHTDEQHSPHGDHAGEHTDEHELAARAANGDAAAFDELCRRHTTAAWNLAHAVTLCADDAVAAVAEGMGQTFTAQRAGRLDGATAFRTHLLTHTHDKALDRVRARTEQTPPLRSAAGDPHLATAFSGLPDRWRGPLWLDAVDAADRSAIATITRLPGADVDELLTRARHGLVERYLRTPGVDAPARNCRRAVARLGAHVAGSLPDRDRQKLERHLSLCESCTAVHARLSTLDAALPLLAVSVPGIARERSRAAWTAAVSAGTTRSGLSPRAEKVLAGVSAFAAAVGVLGAALYAVQDDGDTQPSAAAPVAPLVERVATPRPFDLSNGIAVPAADRRDVGAGVTSGAIETAAATTTPPAAVPSAPRSDSPIAATGPDGGTTAAEAPTSPVDDLVENSPVPIPDGIVPETEDLTEPVDELLDASPIPLPSTDDLLPGSDAGSDGTDEPADGSDVQDPVESVVEPVTEVVTEPVTETVETTGGSLGL